MIDQVLDLDLFIYVNDYFYLLNTVLQSFDHGMTKKTYERYHQTNKSDKLKNYKMWEECDKLLKDCSEKDLFEISMKISDALTHFI